MDEKIMALVERLIKAEVELSKYKEMNKALTNVIWEREAAEAANCEKLSDIVIKTESVRRVLGIVPCPEAINRIKERKLKEAEGDGSFGFT